MDVICAWRDDNSEMLLGTLRALAPLSLIEEKNGVSIRSDLGCDLGERTPWVWTIRTGNASGPALLLL